MSNELNCRMGKDELTWSGVLDDEDEAAGDQCTGQATPRSSVLSSFAFSPGLGFFSLWVLSLKFWICFLRALFLFFSLFAQVPLPSSSSLTLLLRPCICSYARSPARRPSVQGAAQPETRLVLVRWLATASLCFCLVCFSSRPLVFFCVLPPLVFVFFLFCRFCFWRLVLKKDEADGDVEFWFSLYFFYSPPPLFFVAFSGLYKAREWLLFVHSCLTIVRHVHLCFSEKKRRSIRLVINFVAPEIATWGQWAGDVFWFISY